MLRDPTMIDELLQIYYDDLYTRHLGQDKTLDLIKCKFYWDGLYADIKSHMKSCLEYQFNTVP